MNMECDQTTSRNIFESMIDTMKCQSLQADLLRCYNSVKRHVRGDSTIAENLKSLISVDSNQTLCSTCFITQSNDHTIDKSNESVSNALSRTPMVKTDKVKQRTGKTLHGIMSIANDRRIDRCQRLLAETFNSYRTYLRDGHGFRAAELLASQKYLETFCALEDNDDIAGKFTDTFSYLWPVCVDLLDFYRFFLEHENSDVAESLTLKKYEKSFVKMGMSLGDARDLCLKAIDGAQSTKKSIESKASQTVEESEKVNQPKKFPFPTVDKCNEGSKDCPTWQHLCVESFNFFHSLIDKGNTAEVAQAITVTEYLKFFTALGERIKEDQKEKKGILSESNINDRKDHSRLPDIVETIRLPVVNVPGNPGKRKFELSYDESAKKFSRRDMSLDFSNLSDFECGSISSNSVDEASRQSAEALLGEQSKNGVVAAEQITNFHITDEKSPDSAISPFCHDTNSLDKLYAGPTTNEERLATQKTSILSENTITSDTGTKFGIVPSKFPEIKLADCHQSAIADKLQEIIILLYEDTKNTKLCLENGFIIVTCMDVLDVDWIKERSQMLLLPELSLEIIHEHQLPLILEGKFKSSSWDTTEQIMEFISCQNVDLQVDEWKVFERKDIDGVDVEMVFVVPSDAFEYLKSVNFTIEFKFGTVTLQTRLGDEQNVSEMKNGVMFIDSGRENAPRGKSPTKKPRNSVDSERPQSEKTEELTIATSLQFSGEEQNVLERKNVMSSNDLWREKGARMNGPTEKPQIVENLIEPGRLQSIKSKRPTIAKSVQCSKEEQGVSVGIKATTSNDSKREKGPSMKSPTGKPQIVENLIEPGRLQSNKTEELTIAKSVRCSKKEQDVSERIKATTSNDSKREKGPSMKSPTEKPQIVENLIEPGRLQSNKTEELTIAKSAQCSREEQNVKRNKGSTTIENHADMHQSEKTGKITKGMSARLFDWLSFDFDSEDQSFARQVRQNPRTYTDFQMRNGVMFRSLSHALTGKPIVVPVVPRRFEPRVIRQFHNCEDGFEKSFEELNNTVFVRGGSEKLYLQMEGCGRCKKLRSSRKGTVSENG